MDDHATIVSATSALADAGVLGLVWFDRSLVVARSFGRLASFVKAGEAINDAVVPLVGLEAQIASLVSAPGQTVELPSVSLRTDGAPPGRLDITILWSPAANSFLLTMTRAVSTPDLEIQLAQQVRARLMAERDATALSKELVRANRDLEEFASIISHDLATPLRAMRYVAEEATAALAQGDIRGTGEKIDQMREQARRLSAMQRGLLDYSVAGRKGDIVTPVDLKSLVQSVTARLPKGSGLTIHLEGDWPTITTAAAPLDLVLRNLLDNAVKHHDRTTKSIVLSARELADAVEISVSDDGPGIDPSHHAAILLPFRRLSMAGDQAGVGLGLALVKRAIDLAGGQLSMFSNPAERRGTTFRIIWPKQLAP